MNRITTDIKQNFNATIQQALLNLPDGAYFKIIMNEKFVRGKCKLDSLQSLNYFVQGESFTMEHPTDMNVLLVLYQGLVAGECKIVPLK